MANRRERSPAPGSGEDVAVADAADAAIAGVASRAVGAAPVAVALQLVGARHGADPGDYLGAAGKADVSRDGQRARASHLFKLVERADEALLDQLPEHEVLVPGSGEVEHDERAVYERQSGEVGGVCLTTSTSARISSTVRLAPSTAPSMGC